MYKENAYLSLSSEMFSEDKDKEMHFIEERNSKLISCLQKMVYSDEISIQGIEMAKVNDRAQKCREIEAAAWELMPENGIWGGDNEYYWFRVRVQIPCSYEGKTVVLELRTGQEGKWDATNPQFLAFVDGQPRQGLDVNHREILLTEHAKTGESFSIELFAFTGVQNFRLQMNLEMKILHREIEKYYYDVKVPFQVMELLDRESREAITISEAITGSLNLVDFRKEYSELFYESLKRAQKYITETFYEKQCGNSTEIIYAVGHTHIDVAWMWTLSVTQDKAVRSFATVLELMRQYPEYIFMSSQPQLYIYVKEHAPQLYEDIQKRIREGRWEAEGGMFLEADCNLASGESLVRQLLVGKQFFKEEFQKDSKILWLPDVFGYSAALPQIMKQCGIQYFMTTKISWNETNKMPYDTFLWQGIDGTEILTHFVSTRDYYPSLIVEGKKRPKHFTTYNGYLNPSQVMGTWKRYSQKKLNKSALMCYGYGDGGGGTTRDMLENQRRLSRGIPGCPTVKPCTAGEFFENLDKETKAKAELPRWVGELYLEYHRGTYTSMARNKKYNRRSEFLLQNTEFIWILGEWAGHIEYPRQELRALWEILLRNQFHDILPGSSIREVYEDSKKEYEQLQDVGNRLKKAGQRAIASWISAEKGSLVVFNYNGFEGSDYVRIPWPGLKEPAAWDGKKEYPLQKTWDGQALFWAEKIPSQGYKTLVLRERRGSKKQEFWMFKQGLETEDLKVIWNEKGQFVSIYDKKNHREILKQGQYGNELITYEDRPHNYDAWDINNYYTVKKWKIEEAAQIKIVECGELRAVLRIKRRYLDSTIEQDVIFYAKGTRIDIINRIDWKEKNILLRAYFPVDIHAEQATYEIQYGNVQRPTHFNTSWEQAKFEVCAHKWIDISEDGYGVSVLNDCKYGCDIHNGVIGLTMLKSPCYPNPDADKERHEFSYSIVPHAEGWREAHTIQRAYAFNNPMTAITKVNSSGYLAEEYSFVSTSRENVIIESVKKAEKEDAVIVRMYEAFHRTTEVNVGFGPQIYKAYTCNLLEENEMVLEIEKNTVTLTFRPYEIKSLKVFIEDCRTISSDY